MTKKVYIFLAFFCINVLSLFALFNYLSTVKTDKFIQELKNGVKITGLTDMALVTEARYIRHRTLSDIYSIFDFSPEVREVFYISFIYGKTDSYNSEKILIK